MPGMATKAFRLPVAGAAFLALADTAIVALALPPILRELDTDVAGVAAVLGVYAVVLAVALPIAERAREAVGTRAVGVAGVALFAGGSLACGLADNLDVLLVARAVQALGGAALLVIAYALLADGATGARLWSLAALLGTAAGPAIGGALTQALGWRAIFLFQAPVALVALPGALRAGDTLGPRPARRRGRRRSLAEREAEEGLGGRRRLAERPRWALGRALALGLVSGAIVAALFLTVLLLITGWGIEPLEAALAVSVMPLAALAATRIPGPAPVRAAGGALLVAAGAAALAFVPTASVAWTIPPQLAVGVGMGLHRSRRRQAVLVPALRDEGPRLHQVADRARDRGQMQRAGVDRRPAGDRAAPSGHQERNVGAAGMVAVETARLRDQARMGRRRAARQAPHLRQHRRPRQRHRGYHQAVGMDQLAVRHLAELEGHRLDPQHLAGQADPEGHSRRRGRRVAAKTGAQAIVVSNHGGRQLDGAPSSIEVLPEIVDTVGSKMEIMFDGGIRTGMDVMRALALGAKSCMIGRAYAYGLGAGGEAGVAKAIDILAKELTTTMGLCGVNTIAEIDDNVLAI